jgi:hypothetical protein
MTKKHRGPVYAPDSQPPSGYLGWHQWAHDMSVIHHQCQRQCPRCRLWKFPVEQSELKEYHMLETKTGKLMKQLSPVCVHCAAKQVADQ